jgi:hypothetical protein
MVLKYGNLKHLEISGPVQACNGNALHFTNKSGYIALLTIKPSAFGHNRTNRRYPAVDIAGGTLQLI